MVTNLENHGLLAHTLNVLNPAASERSLSKSAAHEETRLVLRALRSET